MKLDASQRISLEKSSLVNLRIAGTTPFNTHKIFITNNFW